MIIFVSMNRKSALLIIAVFAGCMAVKAQEQTTDNLPNNEERISKLEKIAAKLPQISGFVNIRYQYDGADKTNSFDLRRARLNLQGNIAKPLTYRLQVEFANAPRILDAHIQWKINDYVNIRAGQFKVPFSIENVHYSPTSLEVMDNSLVIAGLSGYSDVSGVSSAGRDIGLSVNGTALNREGYSIINYSVGVFNGAGINRADVNKAKDYVGMLSLNPIKALTFAGYHYNGRAGAQGDTFKRIRTGVGAKYDDGKLLVRSEYIWGKTGDMKSEGAYAVVGYHVHRMIQLIAKYDYFKRDTSDNDTTQHNYTGGVNFIPIKYLRVQVNYVRETSPVQKSDYVGVQLLGIF